MMHPYKTLNVGLNDDNETIRMAYLQAVRMHPPEADPAGFKAVNDAYEQIKSEDVRLGLEIGGRFAESIPSLHLSTPMEAAVAFLNADVSPKPPTEEDFHTFLKS